MKIRIQRLCFAMACPVTALAAPDQHDASAEIHTFKAEIIHEITAQRAAYREDLRVRDEQLNKLSGELQASRDYVTRLQKQLKRLEIQQQSIALGNQQLSVMLAENIEALSQQIEAEAKSRDAADRKLAETIRFLIVSSTTTAPTPVPDTSQPQAGNRTYTVAKGDTLSAIALAFNASVATIKERNNLESDLITIGQKLQIPELVP